jgi:hypothetical protein
VERRKAIRDHVGAVVQKECGPEIQEHFEDGIDFDSAIDVVVSYRYSLIALSASSLVILPQ